MFEENLLKLSDESKGVKLSLCVIFLLLLCKMSWNYMNKQILYWLQNKVLNFFITQKIKTELYRRCHLYFMWKLNKCLLVMGFSFNWTCFLGIFLDFPHELIIFMSVNCNLVISASCPRLLLFLLYVEGLWSLLVHTEDPGNLLHEYTRITETQIYITDSFESVYSH